MNTSSSDPYYVARDAVNQTVIKTQGKYKEWELCLNKSGLDTGSFIEMTKTLLDEVESLHEDLSVIDSSIKAVEANPQRYALTGTELGMRKQWVSAQYRLCTDIRARVTGPQAKARIEAERRNSATIADEQANSKRAAVDAHRDSIQSSKQVQRQIIAQQDDTLTELARVTDRLGQTAVVINTELQDQQRLLNELDQDIDRQQEKMNYVMGKMSKLLKTSDTKQLIFVLILLVIAVVLFMMNLSV